MLADARVLGALDALQRSQLGWLATTKRVAKRRARIWPEEEGGAPPEAFDRKVQTNNGLPKIISELPECWCPAGLEPGARYVDAEEGDDYATGRATLAGAELYTIHAWRTLARVQQWLDEIKAAAGDECVLNARIYLRRGRTWDGVTEHADTSRAVSISRPWASLSASEPVLNIEGLRASHAHPLVIGCYEDLNPGNPGASRSASLPLIDGVQRSADGALYGDNRRCLMVKDSCNVYVHHVAIRGFGYAIEVLGASRSQVYEALELYDNAKTAIHITTDRSDATDTAGNIDASLIQAMINQRAYPDRVAVIDCTCRSNGYDTAGGDIGLGFLATNCTISGNTLTGDDAVEGPRGIDGIVAQSASSGHLIEDNRISTHRAWCEGAQIGLNSSCATPTQVLSQECTTTDTTGALYPVSSSCTAGSYGYEVVYATPSGDSAFGEDGIDLKGVRQRTPTARRETIVRGNVIWGHRNFTGVAIADGSQYVYVYRNRIFLNGTGISVTNGNNTGWYTGHYDLDYYKEKTENIFIYRNLIYMNLGRGIYVHSDRQEATVTTRVGQFTRKHVYQVADVSIINNTIAHNLWAGVHVGNRDGVDGDVDGIELYNNLIMRNGLEAAAGVPTVTEQSVQVALVGELRWPSLGLQPPDAVRSDFNCLLGWPGIGVMGDEVIWVRTTTTTYGAWSAARVRTRYALELSSKQVANLADLDLSCETDLQATFEVFSSRGEPLLPEIVGGTAGISASTIELLDYDIWTGSACRNAGTESTGTQQVDSAVDIALSDDLEGEPVAGSPDIGAFEVWHPPPIRDFAAATHPRHGRSA